MYLFKAYAMAKACQPTLVTTRAADLRQLLRPAEAYGVPTGLAMFYLACMDLDQAMPWIMRAVEQHDQRVNVIHRLVPALRSRPGWPELAKMMNLPETLNAG